METGFLKNCVVVGRPDQQGAMFCSDADGRIIARLDGYAIIPRNIGWRGLGLFLSLLFKRV